MVCSAEEMEWLLEQAEQPGTTNVSTPPSVSSSSQGPVLVRELPRKAGSPAVQGEEIQKASGPAVLREMPKRVDAPAVLEPPRFPVQLEPPEPPPTQSQPLAQPASSSVAEPAGKPKMPKRGWLERWLFPDPADPRRKAARLPVAGLTAHFFTGGAPQAHDIRDISTTGLYVVTTERWYPGTLIRMTLSKPDIGQHPSERSITVHAKSVRWGNDGVGLEFVLEAARKPNKGKPAPFDPVDSARLDTFLRRLTSGGV